MRATDPTTPLRRALTALCAAGLMLATAAPAAAQDAGTAPQVGTPQFGMLFPEPFVVEHHLVQTDADGTRYAGDPVSDHYGGSWIVSVRPDGSRRVVDLARREVTEIDPDRGTWWRLSFDRLADLAARLARAERRRPLAADGDDAADDGAPGRATARSAAEPELVVQELPAPAAAASRVGGAESRDARLAPTVQRLRVVAADRADDPEAGVEVWVDRSLRLGAAARQALAAFEATLGGPDGGGAGRPDLGRHLAAARSHTGGAVPVRTRRALTAPGRDGGPPIPAGHLEDVALRVERLDELPRELVGVPEGLRRVPHPMEAVVAFLEEEKEIDRAMSGGGGR